MITTHEITVFMTGFMIPHPVIRFYVHRLGDLPDEEVTDATIGQLLLANDLQHDSAIIHLTPFQDGAMALVCSIESRRPSPFFPRPQFCLVFFSDCTLAATTREVIVRWWQWIYGGNGT
jgi:hypothetical protein